MCGHRDESQRGRQKRVHHDLVAHAFGVLRRRPATYWKAFYRR